MAPLTCVVPQSSGAVNVESHSNVHVSVKSNLPSLLASPLTSIGAVSQSSCVASVFAASSMICGLSTGTLPVLVTMKLYVTLADVSPNFMVMVIGPSSSLTCLFK